MNKLKKTLIFGWAAVLVAGTVLFFVSRDCPQADPRLEVSWTEVAGKPCWYFFCEDFPAFWSRFEKTPAGASLKENASFLIDMPRLMLRQTLGIRFTPLRWRLWLGRRTGFGWYPDDGRWFLAAEGGVLSGLLGKYLWNTSRTCIHSETDAQTIAVQMTPDGEVYLTCGCSHLLKLEKKIRNINKKLNTFYIDTNGIVNGIWDNAPPQITTQTFTPPEGSLNNVLSMNPMFFISGKLFSFFLSEKLLNKKKVLGWVSALFKEEFIGFYFFGFKTEQGVPIPDILLVTRSGNGGFIAEPRQLPVRKRGIGTRTGWELDVFSPWLQLYGVSKGERQYVVTMISRLEELLNQPDPEPARETPEKGGRWLLARIQWPILAKSVRQWLQFLAEHEMVPGISDPRELDLSWFPLMQWLETLGDAEVSFSPAAGGAWQIQGHLWNVSGPAS